MSNMTPRNSAQKNAQHYFSKGEPRSDTTLAKLQKKERAAVAANTARLRELRLAKEAAEKQANEVSGIDPSKRRRSRTIKTVVRMSY